MVLALFNYVDTTCSECYFTFSSHVPLNKVEIFGVHCKQYYVLDAVSYFTSSLDRRLLEMPWNMTNAGYFLSWYSSADQLLSTL